MSEGTDQPAKLEDISVVDESSRQQLDDRQVVDYRAE